MAATVLPTSEENRFSRSRVPFEQTPFAAQWRANLTGLSQVHNLYFVAYGADVYVYEPQFPTQKLPRDPALIFTSQPSAPRLTGHIDRRQPHTINNLVVQFLGNEEVVATVRDDGDVDAFLVRHIVQGIERRTEESNTLGVHANEIRPFFQANVSQSAWGLAIHARARILATSSNAHEVRVFKFGLLQTDNEVSDETDEASSKPVEFASHPQAARETDVTHQILNGNCNIPYISFCNTGDDPEGRWLLTTDIGGISRIMDLHELQAVQVFSFSRLTRSLQWGGFDRINAGWIVMFLDTRSFQEEDSVHNALGLHEDEMLPNIKRIPDIWDLSKTVERLPGYSQPFVYTKASRQENSDPATLPQHETLASPFPGDNEYDESVDDSDGGAPLDFEMENSSEMSEDDMEEATSIEHISTNFHSGQAIEEQARESSPDAASDDIDHDMITQFGHDGADPIAIVDDSHDPDEEMTEDTMSFNNWYNGDTISYNAPEYHMKNLSVCDDLPCPILHASVRNIYLLQPSKQHHPPEADMPPMVGLANPLRQKIQLDFDFLCHFQRLNMATYILPLGIVVIASQKGRALVLSLTKLLPSAKCPPEMLPKKSNKSEPNLGPHSTWREKTTYAMRVECILPFAHQESANQRPFAPLHGIAASPVQGFERDAGKRTSRWRLMMMYQDHTILSYEVSRGGDRDAPRIGNSGVAGLERMVV